MAKVRKARKLRELANLAYENAKDARSNFEDLNRQANEADKDVEGAWRQHIDPKIFAEDE